MMLMDSLPRSAFQKIYLVDLTPSLCAQARLTVQAHTQTHTLRFVSLRGDETKGDEEVQTNRDQINGGKR